ncbi:hypothetical protein MKW98_030236, partial [Papaver atlanticum]
MINPSCPYGGGTTMQIPSAGSSTSIPQAQAHLNNNNPSSPFQSPTISTSNNNPFQQNSPGAVTTAALTAATSLMNSSVNSSANVSMQQPAQSILNCLYLFLLLVLVEISRVISSPDAQGYYFRCQVNEGYPILDGSRSHSPNRHIFSDIWSFGCTMIKMVTWKTSSESTVPRGSHTYDHPQQNCFSYSGISRNSNGTPRFSY